MMQINIHGKIDNSDDTNYRYKMAKLSISREKEFFVLENIVQIGRDLNRDHKAIIKFLQKKLATSIIFKDNKGKTTKKITYNDVQPLIYDFIEENVLCKTCRNPETILTTEKKKTIMSCKACSYRGEL